jgi:hypothetical protein
MPRTIVIRTPCGLSAATFWALRSDVGFDDWSCKLDKQIFELEKNDKTDNPDGTVSVDRVFKMYMQEEQIPKALKNMMPAANNFFVKVVAGFSPHHFDEQHGYE